MCTHPNKGDGFIKTMISKILILSIITIQTTLNVRSSNNINNNTLPVHTAQQTQNEKADISAKIIDLVKEPQNDTNIEIESLAVLNLKAKPSENMDNMQKPKIFGENNPVPNHNNHINAICGVFDGPSGKETYYNLPMQGIIEMMYNLGYPEEEYPYWIREDGVKMFGDYIIVAANLELRPRGTIIECSLGTAIVCDTGGFAKKNKTQLDIAVNWE